MSNLFYRMIVGGEWSFTEDHKIDFTASANRLNMSVTQLHKAIENFNSTFNKIGKNK